MFCFFEQYQIKIKTMSANSRPTKCVLSSFFRSKCFMTISMSLSCQSTFPNNNNLHRIDKVQTAFGPCFSRFKRQLETLLSFFQTASYLTVSFEPNTICLCWISKSNASQISFSKKILVTTLSLNSSNP